MSKKYLIIYHREDNDGVVSAAMAYNYIKNNHQEDPVIDTFGADYNDLKTVNEEVIDEWKNEYDNVVLLDVSFNDLKMMKHIHDVFGNHFTWVDHHKPVIDASYKMKFADTNGLRDVNNCTIINLWRYLYDFMDERWNRRDVPELWRILSGWDSWSFEREGYDKQFCYDVNKGVLVKCGLDLNKMLEFERDVQARYEHRHDDNRIDVSEYDVNSLRSIGAMINDYELSQIKELLKNSGDFDWTVDGRPAVALFRQGSSNSMFFSDFQNTDYRHGIVFKRNPNTTWSVSLYNINDDEQFHCGEYLRTNYGGGGHAGAAGCVIDEKRFIKILKIKQL